MTERTDKQIADAIRSQVLTIIADLKELSRRGYNPGNITISHEVGGLYRHSEFSPQKVIRL